MVVCAAGITLQAQAQNRGVYPLGMTATNSGVTPSAGFSYSNQLLYYFRNSAKDNDGNTLPVMGSNYVLMDMNTFVWVSEKKILGGAAFSSAATLPFAKNNLTSDTQDTSTGGSGFADSYYMPVILGWNRERVCVRAIYGFLAPTGHYQAGETDNVGSGYWTHALSSGQTVYLDPDKQWNLSLFEMYEFHTTQEGTDTHPGQTFDLDYSLLRSFPMRDSIQLQFGLVGYEQRQTTSTTGPTISTAQSGDRYAVNGLGPAILAAFPTTHTSVGVKYFQEFSNRSTFQGYSLQGFGSIHF